MYGEVARFYFKRSMETWATEDLNHSLYILTIKTSIKDAEGFEILVADFTTFIRLFISSKF